MKRATKRTAERTVLLMVLGPKPGALTVCLDYFARQHRPRQCFDRIVILTTTTGQRALAAIVGGPVWQALKRACNGRLPVPEVAVFRRKGRALKEIRTALDFSAAQQKIFQTYRELKQAGGHLFCNTGGGCYFLSPLIAFAAMYHGNGDELFELLLPPECRQPAVLTLPAGVAAQYVSIPFVRLSALHGGGRCLADDYAALATSTQRAVNACPRGRVRRIHFDSRSRQLTIDGVPLLLTPKAMAVYAFFLDLALLGKPFVAMKELVSQPRLRALAEELFPQNDFKFDEALLRESISRINRAMRLRAKGGDGAHIAARGARWSKSYGITLPASAIHYS